MRLLCATGKKHTYAETQLSLSCEGYEFKTKGKTVVQNGWKAIEELFKASLKAKEKDDLVKSDRKSTRLNSSHNNQSRMPSSA